VTYGLHCLRIASFFVSRRVHQTDINDPTKSAYYMDNLEPDVQRVRSASIKAALAYNPGFYDGRIVLFKSKLGDPNSCDPFEIWKRKVADLVVVLVPGSHGTMIRKPHVEVLAGEVSRCLRAEMN
jgi:thioesterase domain-containing protein